MTWWRVIAGRSRSGKATSLLRIWAWYEWADIHLRPNRPIPDAPAGVLQITLTRHRGPSFSLLDGTTVRSGDVVCRLHINNRALLQITWQGRWRLEGAMRGDLAALAAAFDRGDIPADVPAIFGKTILARGAVRLGFVVRPCRHTFKAFLDRLYFQGLMILYTPQGIGRLASGRSLGSWPDEAWMSRRKLLRQYGGQSGAPAEEKGTSHGV